MSELEKPVPSKTEALDFTDRFRVAFDNFCDSAEEVAKFLQESLEIDYWQGAEYDSWKEWYETEYADHITFLKDVKLSLDTRTDIVESLANGGLSNRQIAATIGVGESTVRRDLKVSRELDASCGASNEVDAAGQDVEEVGLIEDNESPLQIDDESSPTVIEKPRVFEEANEESDEERKARLDSWMDTINFDAMILPTSTQIIEAEPSKDTTEYFVPRPVAPKPLEVINPKLPPPRIKAYDDGSDDFLAPPLKLQKVQDPNKDDTKHCKTCACNLLP